MEQSASGVSAPLCSQRRCHSRLSVHRSPYLRLCRELPLNCHLRFFAGLARPLARSPVCCITAVQSFHETGSVSGRGGVCSRALKLKGRRCSLLPLRSFPSCAGGEFKAAFFGFRLFDFESCRGAAGSTGESIYAGLKNNPRFDLQHRYKD